MAYSLPREVTDAIHACKIQWSTGGWRSYLPLPSGRASVECGHRHRSAPIAYNCLVRRERAARDT